MMKPAALAVCGLLLWAGAPAAQVQTPEPQGRERAIADINWAPIPQSLEEMITRSKLIVEVTVISAFPATRRAITDTAFLLSTDIVLAPQKVLKGQVTAERFVVNQAGGELEGNRQITRGYPGGLMSPGQRYILFLDDPDPQSPVQPRDSLQRFAISFHIPGVVRVEQGKVELSTDLSFRGSYEGMPAAQFMDEIAARVKAQSR